MRLFINQYNLKHVFKIGLYDLLVEHINIYLDQIFIRSIRTYSSIQYDETVYNYYFVK